MTRQLDDVGAADNAGPAPVRQAPLLDWPRRVRVLFGGETLADSSRARLLIEPKRHPVHYFPPEDVRQDRLVPSGTSRRAPSKGAATMFHVEAGGRLAQDAAWSYREPPPYAAELAGYVAFEWDAMDAWFEEDDQLFTSPKSPFHRIDVLNSSRHVRVESGGVTLADTSHPRLLFETGLPVRYYLPKIDIRLALLEPSPTVTHCPYKGAASHLHARVGDRLIEDAAWLYPTPLPESAKIENLVCFYDTKADVYVDGEPVRRERSR